MLDERRLARAGVTDQTDKLTAPDGQTHIVQRHMLKRRIHPVDMRQVFDL